MSTPGARTRQAGAPYVRQSRDETASASSGHALAARNRLSTSPTSPRRIPRPAARAGRARRFRNWLRILGVLLVTSMTLNAAPEPLAPSLPGDLVLNGGFDLNTKGWGTDQPYTSLRRSANAMHGTGAAVLETRAGADAVLEGIRPTVPSTTADVRYAVSAWVRTDTPGLVGQVRVHEAGGSDDRMSAQGFSLTDESWTRVRYSFKPAGAGSTFTVSVVGSDMRAGQRFYVDSVSLMATALEEPMPKRTTVPQTDEVAISERGLPLTGAYLGAAVGSNSDPSAFERRLGQRLGVRRTYWSAEQVDTAASVAREDLARGRLPWISFKLPHSWGGMASGVGDDWVEDVTQKLAELPGPVWVAFHHEPEGDGRIEDWTAMQERLAPMVRRGAPNVGFTVILTGWHQLYGPAEHSLQAIWPRTKVDVAGFDVYNQYGTVVKGRTLTRPTDMRGAYFEPLSRWARSTKVAWAVAETGFSDPASKRYPAWIEETFADVVGTGGVAMCYFNTTLNSKSSWAISSPAKERQYARALQRSSKFPRIT